MPLRRSPITSAANPRRASRSVSGPAVERRHRYLREPSHRGRPWGNTYLSQLNADPNRHPSLPSWVRPREGPPPFRDSFVVIIGPPSPRPLARVASTRMLGRPPALSLSQRAPGQPSRTYSSPAQERRHPNHSRYLSSSKASSPESLRSFHLPRRADGRTDRGGAPNRNVPDAVPHGVSAYTPTAHSEPH